MSLLFSLLPQGGFCTFVTSVSSLGVDMVAKRKTAEGAKSESSESPASEHKRKRVIPVAAVEQLAAAAVPAAKDDIVMVRYCGIIFKIFVCCGCYGRQGL